MKRSPCSFILHLASVHCSHSLQALGSTPKQFNRPRINYCPFMQAPEWLPVTTDLLSLYNIGASFSIPWERYQEKAATARATFVPICPSREWGGNYCVRALPCARHESLAEHLAGEGLQTALVQAMQEAQCCGRAGSRVWSPYPARGQRAACPEGNVFNIF